VKYFREAHFAAALHCRLWFSSNRPAAPKQNSAIAVVAFRPAGFDEYGMRASSVQPWSPADGSTVDPWSCLRGCDEDSSCLAVFTTKANENWACWMIEGGTGLGYTAGSVKAAPTQINLFLWAWSTLPTNTPGVS
jgi:hypothetical protein